MFIILIFQLFCRLTFIKIRICRKTHFNKVQTAGAGRWSEVGGLEAKEAAEDCGSYKLGKR